MQFVKKAAILRDRAHMLEEARSFFQRRGILEVDCGSLVRSPSLDAHIDTMPAQVTDREKGYLHTSPEYSMKRLLAFGIGDIYYLGHVFRQGEIGDLHNPEFTMIEWYRAGLTLEALAQEACDLIMLFVGAFPVRSISYRDAFLEFAGVDPFADEDWARAAVQLGLVPPPESENWDRDTWLNLLISHAVEPNLGRGALSVLTSFPPSQAALSCIVEKDGISVAERFEIYFAGVELANGYHELIDPHEQRERFNQENQHRQLQGKELCALDEKFLAALEMGLPDCCGVSVGFDRLMIIRHHVKSIRDVLPFSWEES